MCFEKKPAVSDVTATESQKHNIQAILDLFEQSGQVAFKPVLSAFHLITSAMDGEKAGLMWNVTWIPHCEKQNLSI